VRCARCGNENSDTNRFCGMCGATLLQAGTAAQTVAPTASPTAARPAAPVTPAASAPRPVPPASRPAAPATQEAPSISGPSFLGLNQPAPRTSTGDRASTDANAAPGSRNLDYLLEDDEPPKRSGAGKFVLILVALALAVGMGYLRWRNQGFGWLSPSATKPSAAAQNSDASSPAAPNDNASSTPAPPAGASTQPGEDSSSAANPAAGTPAATPPVTVAPAAQPTAPAMASSSPDPDAASSSSSPASSSGAGNKPPAISSGDADATAEQVSKPTPAIKPAKPTDVVTEAQRYLYGKGVAQNCDRGLKLLKPAADHANPKAMIEMGALYSAGLCTPRDLPTAYRWFAQALRKDPDNQAVQSDLQKLWGEMTQPERQLAIKMSQ
jgi:hypothetical protein